MYEYRAKVLKIIDGDTIHAEIDMGMDLYQNKVLRLYGINTPEIQGAERENGLASKAYVEMALPIGKTVIIRTFKDKTEKYGRYLVNIYNDPKSIYLTLNEELVKMGFATEYFGEGKKL